jgi:prepilin-type N-terminal cleavage/methylation domain-containing protein
MRSRVANQSGVSLIEVLAGVTVFGMVAAAASTSSISSVRANTASRATMAASALIQDKMEGLRSLDPTTGPADFSTGTHYDGANPLDSAGETGGIFTRSWTVTRDTPRRGMAEIVITISWTDTTYRNLSSATYVCLTSKCA